MKPITRNIIYHSSSEECSDLPFDNWCGFMGYFAYELRQNCVSFDRDLNMSDQEHCSVSDFEENFLESDSSCVCDEPTDLPDCYFLFVDRLVVFDHLEKCIYLLGISSSDSILMEEGLFHDRSESRAEIVFTETQNWFDQVESTIEAFCFTDELGADEVDGASCDVDICFEISHGHETYISDVEECLREVD